MKKDEVIVAEWKDVGTNGEPNTLTDDKLIRINPNKPEFGSLMVIQTEFVVANGFGRDRNKVGFITGTVEGLKTMVTNYGLKVGADFCTLVGPHRVVTIEKLEADVPADRGFRVKINPQTEVELTKDGKKIFWRTEVVSSGSDVVDEYIAHDRVPVTAAVDPAVAEFQGAAGGDKTKK